jgi:hypothetical protein
VIWTPRRRLRCAGPRGAATGAAYRYAFSSFGLAYAVEGVFERAGTRLVQLEIVAQAQRASALRDLFTRWVSQVRAAIPQADASHDQYLAIRF